MNLGYTEQVGEEKEKWELRRPKKLGKAGVREDRGMSQRSQGTWVGKQLTDQWDRQERSKDGRTERSKFYVTLSGSQDIPVPGAMWVNRRTLCSVT